MEDHSQPSTLLYSQCQNIFWSYEQSLWEQPYPFRLWISLNDHPTFCFQHLDKHGSVACLTAGAELRKQNVSKLLLATTYCHLLLHTAWLKACSGPFTSAGPECILPTRGCCLQAAAILIWVCLLFPLKYWQSFAKWKYCLQHQYLCAVEAEQLQLPGGPGKHLLVLFGLVVLWHTYCPPLPYSNACW